MSSEILNTASNAFKVSKELMGVASQNIANANVKGYASVDAVVETVVNGNSPQGIKISKLKNKVARELDSAYSAQISKSAKSTIIADHHKEIQDKLGVLNSKEGIYTTLVGFSDSINALQQNPSSLSERDSVVNKAIEFSRSISSTSEDLEKMRINLDQKIKTSLDQVNCILDELYGLSGRRLVASEGTFGYLEIENQIKIQLNNLSEFFDIRHYYDDKGLLNVRVLTNDMPLVGPTRMQFEYDAVKDSNVFIENKKLNPINIVVYDSNNVPSSSYITLVSGGKSSEIMHSLDSGKISGMLQLRDNDIPNILKLLDTISEQTAVQFNKIHNLGSGSMAAQYLRSSNAVTYADTLHGKGEVMINLIDLNSKGDPLKLVDYGYVAPLKIDFSNLNTNIAPGFFNVQGILSEINSYYGALYNGTRAEMGAIYDIKLAATSKDANPTGVGSSMSFDFDLTSYSTDDKVKDSKFTVKRVQARDASGAAITSRITGNYNIDIKNGERIRSGNNDGPGISLSDLSGTYPYEVEVEVEVITNGTKDKATLIFKIDKPNLFDTENVNQLLNKRFSVSKVAVDDKKIVKLFKGIADVVPLSATLVDKDGAEIISGNHREVGFIRIKTGKDSWRLAIGQDKDYASDISGEINGKNVVNKPFSEFFGLNDLFVFDDSLSKKGIGFKVRDDITENSNLFSVGVMTPYKKGVMDDEVPAFFYNLGSSNNNLLSEYQNIQNSSIFFSESGDTPATYATLASYAADIIKVVDNNTKKVISVSESESGLKEDIANQIQNITGVSTDAQMANVMTFNYTAIASSKVMTTVKEMMRVLFDTF